MKYKVLLTGNNKTIIDEFFTNLSDSFTCVTTSLRFDDIINHIKCFSPDVIVYCMNNEHREAVSQMVSVKQKTHSLVPIIILGDPEECSEFSRISINTASMALRKPFTTASIRDEIVKFLKERNREIQEIMEKDRQAALAQIKKRILVVDDDIRMLKIIKEQLHDDYEVATALNGKLALKFLANKPVDLILLDYEMPEENGPTVLNKIRENNDWAEIPVLFLTGVTERDKIQNALSLKPQGYLLKPIDHEKLKETISNVLNN